MSFHRENCRRARYILIALGEIPPETCTNEELACSWPEYMTSVTFRQVVRVMAGRIKEEPMVPLSHLLGMAKTATEREDKEALSILKAAVLAHTDVTTEVLVAEMKRGPAMMPTAFLLDLLGERRSELMQLAQEMTH